MSFRRPVSAVLLALALAGATGACTDSEESDDDAPSQQVPAPEGEEQDDDG